jgi:hypothetical protein
MKSITYNLEVAKPQFLFYIKNMSQELSQWIQFNGIEQNGESLFFNFKSSQNSLTFKIYAGVYHLDTFYLLRSRTNVIYEYFKKLKNE